MSCHARGTTFLAGASVVAALAMVLASGTAPLAQEMRISELGHFTENRGWNEAGLAPAYQIVVTAAVVPSDLPTRVFAEQGGVRQALWHLPLSSAPNAYVYLRRFEPELMGSWRIVAERGEVMPPKTTYFDPKPRSGVFLRLAP